MDCSCHGCMDLGGRVNGLFMPWLYGLGGSVNGLFMPWLYELGG